MDTMETGERAPHAYKAAFEISVSEVQALDDVAKKDDLEEIHLREPEEELTEKESDEDDGKESSSEDEVNLIRDETSAREALNLTMTTTSTENDSYPVAELEDDESDDGDVCNGLTNIWPNRCGVM